MTSNTAERRPQKTAPAPEDGSCELLEGLNTAVFWFDASETLAYMNLAAEAMTLCGRQKARGLPFRQFFPRAGIELSRIGEQILTLHEQRLERIDGVALEVSLTIAPYEVNQRSGWLVEVVETGRHTRIVEVEERWNQYVAGSQLAKTLAHEIRNPLAGIYGASQLLRKRLQGDEKGQRLADVIVDEVRRLQRLVDRMLAFRSTLQLAPHNIHAVIRRVLDIVAEAKPENVAVRLDYDPSIPELMLDFDQMVQAFLNLVRNAFQAMEKKGGILTIRTRVSHRFTLGNRMVPLVAVIQFIDEGEGIPPELFDTIFYPMVTSKADGTGLGLPIAQGIVHQHNGLIVAGSEPGRTVFSVYLPLKEAEDGQGSADLDH